LAKRLPCKIQIPMLKKRFDSLNPGIGSDVIDWRSACGSRETFEETLSDLKYEYPQWAWEKRDIQREDQYSKMALEDLNKQAREFNGACLPSRELSTLRKRAEPKTPKHRGACLGTIVVTPAPYKRCIRWRK
jgi:hypothetical protein